MAAAYHYVAYRESPRVDGLCPHCFNPALKLYTYQRIDWDGITDIGTRVGCRDCKVYIEPLKEFNK
jgi:hypothetical protein